MTRLRMFWRFWILILTLSIIGPASASGGPLIQGQVLDEDAQPIAGAQVRLHPVSLRHVTGEHLRAGRSGIPAVAETATAESGVFRLRAPEIGMWRLQVDAAGKVAMQVRLTPLLQDVDLAPVRMARDMRADLQVLDEGDRPVEGAAVVVFRQAQAVAPAPSGRGDYGVPLWHGAPFLGHSDAAGFVAVPVAQDESVEIQVVAAGFPAVVGKAQRRNRELQEEVWRFVLPSAETGSLKVIDNQGRPVPDVLVFADRRPFPIARTGDDGVAPLTLAAGQSTLLSLSTADGHWGVYTLTAEQDAPGDAPGHVELVLKPPAEVRGRVTDRLAQAPLAGALVWPSRLVGRAVRTDRRGEFVVQLVRGEDRLTAGAPGYRPAFRSATVMQSVRDPQDPAPVELELQPVGSLSGVVLDAAGDPVSGVEISPLPDRRSTRIVQTVTGLDGGFELDRLFAGVAYRVLLQPPEPPPERAAVQGGEGEGAEESLARSAVTWVDVAALSAGEHRPGLVWRLGPARGAFGLVVDAADRPLPGAGVALKLNRGPGAAEDLFLGPPNVFRTVADGDGRFTFAALPPGRYDLHVTASDFVPARVPGLRLPAEEVTWPGGWDLGTVALVEGVEVAGKIENEAGRGIEGAEIQVRVGSRFGFFGGRLLGKQLSDKEGRFVVRGLAPEQEIGFFVVAEGYREQRGVAVTLPTEDVTITLKRASSIRGRVIDPLGWPVARATVSVQAGQLDLGPRNESAQTDAAGEFELGNLAAGPATLRVSARNFRPAQQSIEIPAAEDEALFTEIELETGATLQGRVTTDTGEPIFGARVTAHGPRVHDAQSASTDADGTFTVGGLPSGPLQVRAYKEPYVTELKEIEMEGDAGFVELELKTGSQVWGQVVDADGQGVGAVTVVLTHGGGRPTPTPVTSGPDGSFRFGHVQPGTYTLRAQEGVAYANLDVEVPGGAEDVRLVLGASQGVVVTGQIIGLDLDDLAQIRVMARGDRFVGGQAAYDGSFEIPGVEPGMWRVGAVTREGRTADQEIVVRDGVAPPEVLLEFVPGHTLEGRVTMIGNLSMPRFVQLNGAESRQAPITRDGHFIFRDLKSGFYEASFSGRAHRRLEIRSDRQWNVDLRLGRITGRVMRRTAEGDLVPEAGCGVLLSRIDDGASESPGRPSPMSRMTDGEGNFQLTVEQGRWMVTVHKKGFRAAPFALELTSESAQLEIEGAADTSAGGVDLRPIPR